ncbi:MAG TPA: WD40 repeat domain-containing protein, partial [Aggregatilineaceae bacterium]|nr:WD40 repeat domain-containing protein [Aggregatilineaceae bacterium]
MKYQIFIVLFVFMVFGSSLMPKNQQATGQVNNDTIYAFDYSAAAGMYATGHYDWKIRIWDAATNTLLHTIQAPDLRPNGQGDVFSIQQLAFSPSGERLAACFYAEGGAILVIDTSTGQTLLDISESLPTMKAITWSSDGDRLAGIYEWSAIANEWDGWLALWDAGTGQEIRQTLIGGSPVSLDWHPSDDRLIYPSYTGVSVWDTEQWQELVAIPFESE